MGAHHDGALVHSPMLRTIKGTAAYGHAIGDRIQPGQMLDEPQCGSVRALRFALHRIAERGMEVPGPSRYRPTMLGSGIVTTVPDRWIAIGPKLYNVLAEAVMSEHLVAELRSPKIAGYWVQVTRVLRDGEIGLLNPDGTIEPRGIIGAPMLRPIESLRHSVLREVVDAVSALEEERRQRRYETSPRYWLDDEPSELGSPIAGLRGPFG